MNKKISKLANVRRFYLPELNRRVLEIPKLQAKIELHAAPANRDNNDASSVVSTEATLCAFVDALRSIVRHLPPSRIKSRVTPDEMINSTKSSRFLLKLSQTVTNRGFFYSCHNVLPRVFAVLEDIWQFSSSFEHPRSANWHAFNCGLVAWNVVTRVNDCLLSSFIATFLQRNCFFCQP